MPPYQSLSKKEAPLYDDLINYPRAKDKDEMRCVMCGLPPGEACVIPRQNKDVCKDCDKATWQHVSTSVYFKWCKGCKKFLKLGSFSQKLDAAKCDKCRERGRQSYLLKKGKDGDETQATPSSFHHPHRPRQPPGPPSMYGTRGLRSLFREDMEDRSDFGDDLSIEEDPEAVHAAAFHAPHPHHPHYHPHPGADRRTSMSSASSEAGEKEEGEGEDEEGNADQTLSKMKLSTNFGLPLHHLQVDPTVPTEDQVPTTTSAGVAGPAGNNLRELARIHQRIVELEKTAEQVHIITSKLKEEQTRGRQLEGMITQLQEELAAANSESERLRNELQAWYEREEELLRREMSAGGSEKRTRSDSINGAAALLGGFKKQRVFNEEADGEEKEAGGELIEGGDAGEADGGAEEKRGAAQADMARPSHIVRL